PAAEPALHRTGSDRRGARGGGRGDGRRHGEAAHDAEHDRAARGRRDGPDRRGARDGGGRPVIRSRDPAQAVRTPWGSIQWPINGATHPGSGLTFGYVEIEPGVKNALMRHPNCDEVRYPIEGRVE